MKQIIISGLSVFLIAFSLYTTGCNVNQASYDPTGVGGTITDSSSGRPVSGVRVWIEPTLQEAFTDSNGFYYIGEINCGSSAGNYFLNFDKSGYDSMRLFTILYAGDTTKRINWSLLNLSSQVFNKYNITINENIDITSLSNLDAVSLAAVNGINWTMMDITFIDSALLRNSFYLAAGTYSTPTSGLETYFTGLLYPSLTQAEFDTLSRIDVGNRPINPDIDFPYVRTNSYSISNTRNEIYGFYLKGRLYAGYPYTVYGLLRINSLIYDSYNNIYRIVVDVKTNRRGQNNFIP